MGSKNKKRKKPAHIAKKVQEEKTRRDKLHAFLDEYIWVITLVLFIIVVMLIIYGATNCSESCDTRYNSCTEKCDSCEEKLTSGCSDKKDSDVKYYAPSADGAQLEPPAAGEEYVVMETSMGTIKLRLFPEAAPKTVTNFKNLISTQYYNGVTFHRVMNDFMIQGGDPTGTGGGGAAFNDGVLEDEFSRNLFNFRGALAMANTGAANSGGSQFFIVQSKNSDFTADSLRSAGYPEWAVEKYSELGGRPSLDGVYNRPLVQSYLGHTVFGQVFEGMDVVDAIAAVPVDAASNYKPLEDVVIKSMYLAVYGGSPAASGDAAVIAE